MSPSPFWSTEIKAREEEEREEIKGDNHRFSLAVNPHPPPVPLAHPAVTSVCGYGSGSANGFLVPFHWSIRTHSGGGIKRCVPCRIHTPPCTLFKGNDEGMKIWKCSSQGSVKEAISIMPVSFSCVGENKTFLWCSSTLSSSASTSAGAYREGRTDWGSIKLPRRLTFFETLYLVYTPRVCNHSHSKSLDWLISIFIYPELFAHIKLCGCPW